MEKLIIFKATNDLGDEKDMTTFMLLKVDHITIFTWLGLNNFNPP